MCPHCTITETEHGTLVLVYRCSRCGGCYQCQHVADLRRRRWLCKDGVWRPSIWDPGLPAAAGFTFR